MNRGIYTGARGLIATNQWMDTVANNLANASTDGFKSDMVVFSDVYKNRLFANGGAGSFVGTIGGGPSAIAEQTNFSVGLPRATGNPLDVALRTERGMFKINVDGRETYTRSGSFTVNDSKQLITNTGHLVLDPQGRPIQFGEQGKMEITTSGEVKQNDQVIAELGIFEGSFDKGGNNTWVAKGAVRPLVDPDLAVGHIEASNVQPIEAMVELIKINRAYEMSQKSISTQDDLTGRLIESMNRR
jgi:flagellar basal-body rod protein FlgF